MIFFFVLFLKSKVFGFKYQQVTSSELSRELFIVTMCEFSIYGSMFVFEF